MCNPETWTARYLDVLTNRLGWDARDDGDRIVITFDGLTMLIENTAPSDPEFLHLYLGFAVPTDVARDALVALAGSVTLAMKGTKIALASESVVYSVEQVVAGRDSLASVEHLVAVLPRLRGMLLAAVSRFHRDVVELREQGDVDSQLAGIAAATADALREDDAA